MIPKLIHQTARTAEVPESWQAYQQILRRLHPEWTYKLWTDEDNLAFVKKEFPDFVDVFTGLPKNIMRADVIRYLLMYRLGGMYFDLDYEMLKPFDLTSHDCVLALERDPTVPMKDQIIANASFASAPGHPFFKAVIDDLQANPPFRKDSDVLAATGPAFITRIYREQFHGREKESNIFLAPRVMFAPETPFGDKRYQAIVKTGQSYGIHHCHGSWREFTAWERTRSRVSQTLRKFNLR